MSECLMSMRTMVVVGLLALLCDAAQSAPKKVPKRKGTFAGYIDPSAPEDPPLPWPSFPTWLSVVFLVERSAATDGARLEAAKAATQKAHDALQDWDLAAILAFDTTVEKVFRATVFVKERKKFKQALARMTARGGSDLASALNEARDYMTEAPHRKVIVLFTGVVKSDDRLTTALSLIQKANIDLIVVATPAAKNDLRAFTSSPSVRLHVLDLDDGEVLASILADMHYVR